MLLLQMHISSTHDGATRVLYQVVAAIVEEPGRKLKAYWDVTDVAAGALVAQGWFPCPRATHPDFNGRVVAKVMEKAFPFVQENRYSDTPREGQEENEVINPKKNWR